MTEIGTRLKEAREAKGYTLSDLQEITKIQKRYLVGIENGDYESIPGAFYVRAFIRQYAEAVGLDPDELLETYKNEVPSTPSMESTTVIPAQRQKRGGIGGSPSRQTMEALPKIMVGLFVLVIIIIVVWMYYMQKAKTDIPNASEDPSQTEYAEPVKPIDTEKEREKEETRKKNEEVAKQEAAEKEKAEKEKAEQAAAEKEQAEKDKQAEKEQVAKDKKSEEDKKADKDKAKDNEKAKEKEKKDKDKAKKEPKTEQTVVEDAANSGGNVTTFTVTGPKQLNLDLAFTGDAWIEVRDSATRATLLDNEGKVYTAGEEIKLDNVESKSLYIVIGNINTTEVELNGEKIEYVRQGYPQSLIFNLQ
nr:RodZ domain-containing protein [Lysinibacillus sp. BF-4]